MEFALLVPVFLLLMLLAVDFGRLFFTYIAVNNAAREATYYAAMHAADAEFEITSYNAAVADAGEREANVQGQGGEGTLVVSEPACFSPGSGAPILCDVASDFAPGIGNQVSVSASQPFTFLTPFIGEVVGNPLNLTASATAPVLNPAVLTLVKDPDPDPPPVCATAGFTWSIPEPLLEPRTVEFTDTSAGLPKTWSWDFGDGTPLDTEREPVHIYGAAGTYQVTLVVDGCGYRTLPVTVAAPAPTTCTVPNFIGKFWVNAGAKDADVIWEEAGFDKKNLTNNTAGKLIVKQGLPASSQAACDVKMKVEWK